LLTSRGGSVLASNAASTSWPRRQPPAGRTVPLCRVRLLLDAIRALARAAGALPVGANTRHPLRPSRQECGRHAVSCAIEVLRSQVFSTSNAASRPLNSLHPDSICVNARHPVCPVSGPWALLPAVCRTKASQSLSHKKGTSGQRARSTTGTQPTRRPKCRSLAIRHLSRRSCGPVADR
jgi:hypothetical protein